MDSHEDGLIDASVGALPHQFAEAEAFMTEHAGVHGFGIGADADGAPCMVLFAEALADAEVPERLDGLPVRLEVSDSFTANE